MIIVQYVGGGEEHFLDGAILIFVASRAGAPYKQRVPIAELQAGDVIEKVPGDALTASEVESIGA